MVTTVPLALTKPTNGSSGWGTAVSNNFETIDDRISDLGVNVKDASYGAIGNGTTDDTAAFAGALAASNDVFVPPGTYKVALSLASLQWKRIRGAGMERTILKAPASGTAITFSSGLNHCFTFEDLSIQGAATPAEKGMFAAGATEIGSAWFNRVQFSNLLYGFDTNGTTAETTGLHFTACRFENAPLRFTGSAAHNTMVFDGKCRFSGLSQATPAVEIDNTGGPNDVQIIFVAPVFETIDRQAIKVNHVNFLKLLMPYLENINLTGAASLPWIDVTSNTYGLSISDGFFGGVGSSVYAGSSTAAQSSLGSQFYNNGTNGLGAFDFTTFPDLTLISSPTEINSKFGQGTGMKMTLGSSGSHIGFHGTAPIAKQTGVAVSAAGVHAALVNLGLIT